MTAKLADALPSHGWRLIHFGRVTASSIHFAHSSYRTGISPPGTTWHTKSFGFDAVAGIVIDGESDLCDPVRIGISNLGTVGCAASFRMASPVDVVSLEEFLYEIITAFDAIVAAKERVPMGNPLYTELIQAGWSDEPPVPDPQSAPILSGKSNTGLRLVKEIDGAIVGVSSDWLGYGMKVRIVMPAEKLRTNEIIATADLHLNEAWNAARIEQFARTIIASISYSQKKTCSAVAG